jgi:ribonuclease HI
MVVRLYNSSIESDSWSYYMSHSIVFYTDGSQLGRMPEKLKGIVAKDRNRELIGWAFVALHNDEMIECYGIKTGTGVEDKHEYFALVEAYLYSKSHSYLNSEISVYTDCQDFSDCIFSTRVENYRPTSRENWINKITEFLHTYYEFVEPDLFFEFLHNARIHKVKGHSFMVYNTRADRLAKFAIKQYLCPKEIAHRYCLPNFEAWIQKSAGFKVPFAEYKELDNV